MEAAPLHDDIADAPAGGAAHYRQTRDGTRIRIALWPEGTRGTALVFPGRTEYIEKYGRVVGRLSAMGFAVAAIDWRGQGLSTRIHGTTELGHVRRFSEYQQDVATLLEAIEGLPRPLHLFAHSMGGCIGLRALSEGLPVATATFSAPMWGLKLPPLQRHLAPFVIRLLRAVGRSEDYAPGGRSAAHVALKGYAGNPLTTDEEHFDRLKRQLAAYPQLGLGAPSVGWLAAAFDEMTELLDAPAPTVPVLAAVGSDEQIVAPGAVVTQLERMPTGTLLNIEGARHELWMETAAIQDPLWTRIAAHLEQAVVTA